jgi:hypothetical protein
MNVNNTFRMSTFPGTNFTCDTCYLWLLPNFNGTILIIRNESSCYRIQLLNSHCFQVPAWYCITFNEQCILYFRCYHSRLHAVVVKATPEQLRQSRIPLAWRDGCVDLLLPLNDCRNKTSYMPWKCQHERHTYEKCLYDEFVVVAVVVLFGE